MPGIGEGETVASFDVCDVSMTSDAKRGTTATVRIPKSDGFGNWRIQTDFDTARRMVEGRVSVLVVVSDGDE